MEKFQKGRLELYYLENQSFLLKLSILQHGSVKLTDFKAVKKPEGSESGLV